MQPESAALLWEAHRVCQRITEFLADRSWADYQADVLLRSAVERQFQILGEALNRLSRIDHDIAAQVPDLARIVAFRNVLVHGYVVIDDELLRQVAAERVSIRWTALLLDCSPCRSLASEQPLASRGVLGAGAVGCVPGAAAQVTEVLVR